MPTHFTDSSNRSYPLAQVKDIAPNDVVNNAERREDGKVGNLANNFLGGAPQTVGSLPTTRYFLTITSKDNLITQWEYTTAALRNTAVTNFRTAMNTDPA